MKRLFLAALLAGFALAPTVHSAVKADKKKKEEAPAIDGDQFKKLDANKDGRLSLDEFKAMFDSAIAGKGKKGGPDPYKLFSQLDADNSNFLSPVEFKNLKPADLTVTPKKKK